MLYTAPSGAVQIIAIWLGILGCAIFPRARTAVAAALILIPLVGDILLLVLDVDAGWGIIAASWMVSRMCRQEWSVAAFYSLLVRDLAFPVFCLLSSASRPRTSRATRKDPL